ncbi:MAG TPA: TrbC/VirB2 family protein [Luteibacter sp.]|jgi:type IV secretion system protein VirB2|nr:TrbC/VirB2 family protein [Luteibacter sp.]
MAPTLHNNAAMRPKNLLAASTLVFALIAVLLVPGMALAQDVTETGTKVCGFFTNINTLLNMASIVVVTIAIIFSGYQIAFAHKRIGDVAPILIGGLLIGAAAQIAKMMVGNSSGACTATSGSTTMLIQFIHSYYA